MGRYVADPADRKWRMVSVRLTPDQWAGLERLATKEHRSMADTMRVLLLKALERAMARPDFSPKKTPA